MKRYIVSVDQSTTATKAILFDNNANILQRVDKPHKQITPREGWVEHDGQEIYRNFLTAVKELVVISGIEWDDIAVIAISNQRETVIVWDKETGQPVHNAIVWQCSRAQDICMQDKFRYMAQSIRDKTGLMLSPYFSAPKIKWILDNVNGISEMARKGKLLAGTIDSFLVWKLTEGKTHITDYSNASRTMMFNIHELNWDSEILDLFEIPGSMLAEVVNSDEVVGYTDLEGSSDVKIPIAGLMGDSHGSLFGQCCYSRGMVKCTYGTGSSIMMNIGNQPLKSVHGLVTSIAWGAQNEVEYVLEGNINYAAATVKWLVDDLGILDNAAQSEELAFELKDNGGVYIVPAFTGLGAPYWDSSARAIICGMSAGANRAHIARAALESIAYQVKDILDCVVQDTGISPKELRVDGGPTKNRFLMQFQSDITDTEIKTQNVEELSAKGSAFMAGLAVGIWKDKNELISLVADGEAYKSEMKRVLREKNCIGWELAVKRARLE